MMNYYVFHININKLSQHKHKVGSQAQCFTESQCINHSTSHHMNPSNFEQTSVDGSADLEEMGRCDVVLHVPGCSFFNLPLRGGHLLSQVPLQVTCGDPRFH